MNQEFEAMVMGNYAELCIMWRIAHVKDPGQAIDFDAKLKSLEAVIESFGFAMPDLSDGDFGTPQPQAPVVSEPAPRAAQGPPAENSEGVVLDQEWD